MQSDYDRSVYVPNWKTMKSKPVGFFCCNGVADSDVSIKISAVYKGLIKAFGYVHKKYGLKPFDVQRYENQGEYGIWLDERRDGRFSMRLQPRGMRYSPVLCVFGVDEGKKSIDAGLLAIASNPIQTLKPLEEEALFALAKSKNMVVSQPLNENFIIRSMYV